MPKVSHYNIVCFLRYAHSRYMKCLFTNIKKQQNMLKIAYFLRKIQTSRVNNLRNPGIKNVKFSGYCCYMNPNIYWNFQICIRVPLMVLQSISFTQLAQFIFIHLVAVCRIFCRMNLYVYILIWKYFIEKHSPNL